MRNAIVYSLMLGLLFGCRKKPDIKDAPYSLFAFKKIAPPDLKFKMVSINTQTGESIENLPFPVVLNYWGYLSQEEKAYYTLQTDTVGYLLLYKFDLIEKTTTQYGGPYVGNTLPTGVHASQYQLSYSKSTGKFYCFNAIVDDNTHSYDSHIGVINLTGSTFTIDEIKPIPAPDKIYRPLLANDINGDILFVAGNGIYTYHPHENTFNVNIDHSFSLEVFNTNDNNIYYIYNYKKPQFCKASPLSGDVTVIDTITYMKENSIYYSSFDQKNNIFIIQILDNYTDSNISIYWLDVKNGNIKKQLRVKDSFEGLICLNL